MKFLYLIQAHKNPAQLKDLVDKLRNEDTSVIIHIDAKSDVGLFAFIKELDPSRIFFVERPTSVYWGGISQVNATLRMIELAFMLDIEFDYAHLISGQDVPIVSNNTIVGLLHKHNGNSFIDFNKLPFHRWQYSGGIGRVQYYWLSEKVGSKIAGLIYLLQKGLGIKRKLLAGIELYGGSQWWTLSKEALQYIVKHGMTGSTYYKHFRHTLCPDEIYFQTLLLNSPLREKLVNDNLRYIDWNTGPQWPRMLDETDYEAIIASGKLFARKISGPDNKLVKMLQAGYALENDRSN